jgi:hypothetical protein
LTRQRATVGDLNELLSHVDSAELNDDILESLRTWLEKLVRNAREVAKGEISSSGFWISVEERVVVGIDFSLAKSERP